MGKEQRRAEPIELIIQRKGKTIYARLREDKAFNAAEISGAAAFVAQFASVEQVRKELQDLLVAGSFKIVVPAGSALAPKQAQIVVFGDMTGAAPARKASSEQPAPARPTPAQFAPARPAPARTVPAPALPAPSRPAPAKPAASGKAAPVVKHPVPVPLAPAPQAPAGPKPGSAMAAPVKRRPRKGDVLEEKAFKAFYNEWKVRNKISRIPKQELEELRQGEWQEVKDKFMAEWRKTQEPG